MVRFFAIFAVVFCVFVETAFGQSLMEIADSIVYEEKVEVDVDGELVGEALEKMDRMFKGLEAPGIEGVSELFGAVLGETKEVGGLGAGAFDWKSLGWDYIIGSYAYRDAEAGVEMDIGRVIRTSEGEAGGESEGAYKFVGGNVMSAGKKIVLAMDGGTERVVVETDLESMGKYVAYRKVMEGSFLNPLPVGTYTESEVEGRLWGVKEESPHVVQQVVSTVVDFLPFVGTGKAVSELVFGKDVITGEKMSRVVTVCALAGSFVPVPGAKKLGKFVGTAVEKVVEKGKKIFNKLDDEGKLFVNKDNLPGTYRPNRSLPRDQHGKPIPETDLPHTQLGKKEGRNGEYTQAREFDADGKPIRDIDFTDHGRPKEHPNPHEHKYTENANGGTPKRSEAEKLEL